MTLDKPSPDQSDLLPPPPGIEVMETEEGEFCFQIKIPPEPSHIAQALWKCGLAIIVLGLTFWFPFSNYISNWFLVLPRILMIALIVAFWIFFLASEFLEVTTYTLGEKLFVSKSIILGFTFGENRISRVDAVDVFEKRDDDLKYPCCVAIGIESQEAPFESIPLTEFQCEWLMPIIAKWAGVEK
ncbi:MAG: hypothetical protein KC944_24625 [Candidatus Omnitrophica bacterium]|nr:hypothetical protein [Candidatus Omnitrophota bacterium]